MTRIDRIHTEIKDEEIFAARTTGSDATLMSLRDKSSQLCAQVKEGADEDQKISEILDEINSDISSAFSEDCRTTLFALRDKAMILAA